MFFGTSEFKGSHKKDYSWHGNKTNPYKRKEPIPIKKKIELFILLSTSLVLLAVVIYLPFFHIQKIKVEGLQRINNLEFDEAVLGILDYKKLFIFPGQSYIFADVNEIKDILQEKFPINSIVVKKSFPQTLSIVLEEKISTIIYDNGEKYSYIGLDGNIVELIGNVDENEWEETLEITTTTLADGSIRREEKVIERVHKPNIDNIISQFGDYPILYDARSDKTEINKKIIDPIIVDNVIRWFNFISKKTDIPFGYVLLINQVGDGVIRTREGWEIKIKLTEKFQEQIDELNLLLEEKVSRPNINYIDLRYPGRVYWQ